MDLKFELKECKKEAVDAPTVCTYDIVGGEKSGTLVIDGVQDKVTLSLLISKKEYKSILKFSLLEHIRHELYSIPAVKSAVYCTHSKGDKFAHIHVEMQNVDVFAGATKAIQIISVVLDIILEQMCDPDLGACYDCLSKSLKTKIAHRQTYKKNRQKVGGNQTKHADSIQSEMMIDFIVYNQE